MVCIGVGEIGGGGIVIRAVGEEGRRGRGGVVGVFTLFPVVFCSLSSSSSSLSSLSPFVEAYSSPLSLPILVLDNRNSIQLELHFLFIVSSPDPRARHGLLNSLRPRSFP